MEDLECKNGQDKPYFMDKKLMSLLNMKNKEQTDSTTMRMEPVDTIQAYLIACISCRIIIILRMCIIANIAKL